MTKFLLDIEEFGQVIKGTQRIVKRRVQLHPAFGEDRFGNPLSKHQLVEKSQDLAKEYSGSKLKSSFLHIL